MSNLTDWEEQIVKSIMRQVEGYESLYLMLLLRRLKKHPKALEALAKAMEDKAKFFEAHAAGLDAVAALRAMAGKGGEA